MQGNIIAKSWTAIAFGFVFVVYAVWLGDSFLSVDARLLDLHQNIPIIILGFAVMVTLVAGQFDLSVAAMATLTTFLTIGLPIQHEWPFALVLATVLLIGILGGLLNGLIVVKLRVNAFIATLGMSGVFAGAAQVYSSGTTVVATVDSGQLPKWFNGDPSALGVFTAKAPSWLVWLIVIAAGVALLRGILRSRPGSVAPAVWSGAAAALVAALAVLLFVFIDLSTVVSRTSWMIVVLIAIATVLWAALKFTTFGRYLRATGSNQAAAQLAGVPTDRITISAFVLGGLLAAAAGIVLAANLGSASPGVANQYLLPAFAAAFLSTVMLSRGHFTVWGTLVGGLFIVWVSQGLIAGGLSSTWTDIVNGLVLVAAVGLPAVMKRRG